MGLSSQLAPSAIARPGVIANAAARPASPYDGQVVYQQDTDQAYVWNGSAWVLLSTGTANPPGLELISSASVSNATTVDITGFTTTYAQFRVIMDLARHSGTGGSTVTMTLRDASSGYSTGYYGGGVDMNYLGTVSSYGARNNGADMPIGAVYAPDSPLRAYFDVGGMNTSTSRTTLSGNSYDVPGTRNLAWGFEYAGGRTLVVDRIRLTCAVGMTGTWQLYGYRK